LAERLICTEYSGAAGDRVGHAVTLEGALRAAIIRVATGQYLRAVVYDARFGHKAKAFTVAHVLGGVHIDWTKTPRWTKKQK
jgi:hypothetical protein